METKEWWEIEFYNSDRQVWRICAGSPTAALHMAILAWRERNRLTDYPRFLTLRRVQEGSPDIHQIK
jgi:hypothetical protein